MDYTHEVWKARQEAITNTIIADPNQYFIRGYTIGEYCLINIYLMIKENPFCFANAWSPFIITSNEDKENIRTLKINLDTLIKCSNLEENMINKIIDAYPFLLQKDDSMFELPNSIIERYKNHKANIAAFQKSDFALSLPIELVNFIINMC
jgi:acyl-[acyl carrier protein]--UDP-N-acetylglucosamine O-acyltransferase